MIDWQALTLFLYITARMSGFVLFNPIFGRRSIPGIFRAVWRWCWRFLSLK